MLRYKDGDMQAFEALYTRHKGPLYRYLFRQISDPSVTDDLFQEIWINLIRARDRYEYKAKFTTYLFRIAHNRLIDYYRSHQKSVPLSYSEDQEVDCLETDLNNQPDRQVEVHHEIERLVIHLEKLPEAQREAFLLKEESGLSLEEIAVVTGTNKETVKSRLRYAVNKLRAGMKK